MEANDLPVEEEAAAEFENESVVLCKKKKLQKVYPKALELLGARVKRGIDGRTYFGSVELVEKGEHSGKVLFRVRYDDNDVEHFTELEVRKYQIFYESDYNLDLAALAKDTLFADVIFRCNDGLDVFAHYALLQVRCPPLAQRALQAWEGSAAGEKCVVELESMTAATLQCIVTFLYSEELPFEGAPQTGRPLGVKQVFDVIVAARTINAPVDTSPARRLQVLSEEYLALGINKKTVVPILSRSLKEDCKRLEQLCYAFMRREQPIANVGFREQLCISLAPYPQALALAVGASAGVEEGTDPEHCNLPDSHLGPDMELLWQRVCTANSESQSTKGLGDADCVVQFGDQGVRLQVHRFMLAARSGFFRAAFQHKMQEGVSTRVVLSDPPRLPEGAAYMLLRFLYIGSIDETKQLCPFDALHVLKMIGVEAHLGGFLQVKAVHKFSATLRERLSVAIDFSNAWDLLRVSSALMDSVARSQILRFIASNFANPKVFPADSFNTWCPNYVAGEKGDDEHHNADDVSRVKRRRMTCARLLDVQWNGDKESAMNREVFQALAEHMQRSRP